MKVTRIGMDLAKQVFQVHGVDGGDRPVLRRRLKRSQVLRFFAQLPPCLVGMEACSGGHYWSRQLVALGHTVKLIAAQHVKPYVQGNKHDGNDAEAICEAAGRARVRAVPARSVAQQDLQALHRVRSQQVKQRTACANAIRGLLAEYGIVVGPRVQVLRRALPGLLEDGDNGLSGAFRSLLADLREDLLRLDARVAGLDQAVQRAARGCAWARRLMTIPGIGPITATALVAAIGDIGAFRRGRDLAAWLGLVPRQHSSGGRTRLLGISKRGSTYLRTLMVHGARAVLRHNAHPVTPRGQWLQAVCARRGANIAVVALANKNARTAWALLTRQHDYRLSA